MKSSEPGWVEERTLSGKSGPFAWRLDGLGTLTIRLNRPSGERIMIFPRQALEKIQAFMADGTWHPASIETEEALAARGASSLARFGREELNWGRRQMDSVGQLGAILANAGAWVWDARGRGLTFRLADPSFDCLRAYYERRLKGVAAPKQDHPVRLRRDNPPPFDLAATFRGLGRALRARLEIAEVGRHPVEKGRRREGALRDFLREHLPPAYGVTQGEAVAANGQSSRQMDVLIYDALRAPVLLASDSSMILAAESVYAGIEVKPLLLASALEQAVENLASIKALPTTALMGPPGGIDIEKMPMRNPAVFGAIFGFEGDAPLRLLDTLCALCKGKPPELWPEAVVVLDKAAIHRQGSRFRTLGWSAGYWKHATPYLCHEAGANSLLVFYLMLLQDLNGKAMLAPDLMKYALTLGLPKPTMRKP